MVKKVLSTAFLILIGLFGVAVGVSWVLGIYYWKAVVGVLVVNLYYDGFRRQALANAKIIANKK